MLTKIVSLFILAAVSSTCFAQTTKSLKSNSVMSVNCFSQDKSLMAQANTCKANGAAHSYSLTTLNNEKVLIVTGAKNMKCVITESLAKDFRVPFGLLEEMIASRRIDLQCSYSLPRSSPDAAASHFSIRAYLE